MQVTSPRGPGGRPRDDGYPGAAPASSAAWVRRRRAKAIAFRLAAIAIPLLAVLLVEIVLRIAGVGEGRRAPFQPIEGRPEFVALDPEFGAMFFRGFRPGVAFDPFLADKPEGAFRVMALGGSTTAGFPYHWYYGFPALLEDRLAAALPGRRIEVANLGMTATNSYTIWAMADAVAAQRPNAVVIYSGHNEYYGAFGPGGTQGWPGMPGPMKRLLIRASKWATVAGIDELLEDEEPTSGEQRTLMARIVRNAAIARGDDVFQAGIAQFESNLRDALRTFERAGIPVFLATIASNLADQPPLGEEAAAREAYERGQRSLSAGDSAVAREAFVEARELDGIRFRAPEAMNAVVRSLAAEFDNVTLVDVEDRLRAESPGHIEGAALFADHLHPNAQGYALVADAFFEAMQATFPDLRLRRRTVNGAAEMEDADATEHGPGATEHHPGASEHHPGASERRLRAPELDPVERAFADLQLTILTSGYPFRKDRTPAEAEATARRTAEGMAQSGTYAERLAVRALAEGVPVANVLYDAIQQALEIPDTLAALRLYRSLLHRQPFNESLIERAVALAIENPAYDAETARLARYASIHSDGVFGLNALAALALRGGDLSSADLLLTRIEQIDPFSREMLYNRARLLVMQGDTARARGYFERYQVGGDGR